MFKGQSFYPWDSHLHLKVLYLSIFWGLAYMKYRQDTIFANDIFLLTTRQRSFWKVMFSLVSVSLSIQARCPHVTTAYDAIGQSQGTLDSLDICVHLGTLPPLQARPLTHSEECPLLTFRGPWCNFYQHGDPLTNSLAVGFLCTEKKL